MDIAKGMRRCRAMLDMTQAAVADQAKLSRPYYSQLESGIKEPSWQAIVAIAKAMDVPVLALMVAGSSNEELRKFGPELPAQIDHGLMRLLKRN